MKQLQKEDLAKLAHREQVVFALFCAKQVYHLVEEKHKEAADKCINITERWIVGKVTGEECREVAAAAAAIANAAYTTYAAYAAANAANAASAAIAIENKAKIIEEQWECYNALLNLESYLKDNLIL